jgi:hypothetical protein
MTNELQRALDAARLICAGLTERHIVGVPAGVARTLLAALAASPSDLSRRLRMRPRDRVLWTSTAEILPIIAAVEELVAAQLAA